MVVGCGQYARGVVGQVEEQSHTIQRTVLFKVLLEISSGLHVDTHGGEDDGEVVLVTVVDSLGRSRTVDEPGLTTDLSGDLDDGVSSANSTSWQADERN
jgi:hypothetical protein